MSSLRGMDSLSVAFTLLSFCMAGVQEGALWQAHSVVSSLAKAFPSQPSKRCSRSRGFRGLSATASLCRLSSSIEICICHSHQGRPISATLTRVDALPVHIRFMQGPCQRWLKGMPHLHVEHKALQGETQDGRDAVQPDLARGIHLALAEGAVVFVLALQVLCAQQPGLHKRAHCLRRVAGRLGAVC